MRTAISLRHLKLQGVCVYVCVCVEEDSGAYCLVTASPVTSAFSGIPGPGRGSVPCSPGGEKRGSRLARQTLKLCECGAGVACRGRRYGRPPRKPTEPAASHGTIPTPPGIEPDHMCLHKTISSIQLENSTVRKLRVWFYAENSEKSFLIDVVAKSDLIGHGLSLRRSSQELDSSCVRSPRHTYGHIPEYSFARSAIAVAVPDTTAPAATFLAWYGWIVYQRLVYWYTKSCTSSLCKSINGAQESCDIGFSDRSHASRERALGKVMSFRAAAGGRLVAAGNYDVRVRDVGLPQASDPRCNDSLYRNHRPSRAVLYDSHFDQVSIFVSQGYRVWFTTPFGVSSNFSEALRKFYFQNIPPPNANKDGHYNDTSKVRREIALCGEYVQPSSLPLCLSTMRGASYGGREERHDGNTARLARRSDEALVVRVSVAPAHASKMSSVTNYMAERSTPGKFLANRRPSQYFTQPIRENGYVHIKVIAMHLSLYLLCAMTRLNYTENALSYADEGSQLEQEGESERAQLRQIELLLSLGFTYNAGILRSRVIISVSWASLTKSAVAQVAYEDRVGTQRHNESLFICSPKSVLRICQLVSASVIFGKASSLLELFRNGSDRGGGGGLRSPGEAARVGRDAQTLGAAPIATPPPPPQPSITPPTSLSACPMSPGPGLSAHHRGRLAHLHCSSGTYYPSPPPPSDLYFHIILKPDSRVFAAFVTLLLPGKHLTSAACEHCRHYAGLTRLFESQTVVRSLYLCTALCAQSRLFRCLTAAASVYLLRRSNSGQPRPSTACGLEHKCFVRGTSRWRGFAGLESRRGWNEAGMEQRQNARTGETGDPRENRPNSDIVRHNSHMRESPPGIEPRSPRWNASSLTTKPLQQHGNIARLARRSDEVLGVRVSVARIDPSLLTLECAATY
ncbi:hypothetical protein PR048_001189 [Dryococelus australis]|uniref:Uncharacterized protein n=1 Tax=Dryococelus australis TaxID=614101 RepID=A0ABQ9IGP2_9NEOP|nr:hypothetical protein PR048_001189 [Dryococelus australis]